ncbi:MAG: hypothetical protein WDN75_02540 [Bacteroidota bacterium]
MAFNNGISAVELRASEAAGETFHAFFFEDKSAKIQALINLEKRPEKKSTNQVFYPHYDSVTDYIAE